VALSGPIGSGKTTLAYYSGYAALRILGLPEGDAREIAGRLITNDYKYAAQILHQVSLGGYIPFLVIDDIAALISKYWIWAPKETRKIALNIIKVLKISREGVGLVVLLTDTMESLPKGLKESVDYEFRGEKIRRRGATFTLWKYYSTVSIRAGTLYGAPPWRRGVDREVTLRIPDAYMGTVHPPMWMPQEIKAELEKVKMTRRAELLEETLEEPEAEAGASEG
jgi:hypothetical protein